MLLRISVLILLALSLTAQNPNTFTVPFAGTPTAGANKCSLSQLANDITNGSFYFCDARTGTWTALYSSTTAPAWSATASGIGTYSATRSAPQVVQGALAFNTTSTNGIGLGISLFDQDCSVCDESDDTAFGVNAPVDTRVNYTGAPPATAAFVSPIFTQLTINPNASDVAANLYHSVTGVASTSSARNLTSMASGYFLTAREGSGTNQFMYGVLGISNIGFVGGSTPTISSEVAGILGQAGIGAGTITNSLIGIKGSIYPAGGTVPEATAVNAAADISATVTTVENFKGNTLNCTTYATNCYGLYLADVSGAATINDAIRTNAGRINFNGKTTFESATGLMSTYNSVAKASGENGVPFSTVSATATAQSANIAGTNLVASATAGRYRLSCYVAVTQQATTSSTVPDCNMVCTDPTDSVAKTIQITPAIVGVAVNPATSVGVSGAGICDAKAATAIQYSTTGYASVGGTAMQYKIYLILEAM